jgi:hypothetical protein
MAIHAELVINALLSRKIPANAAAASRTLIRIAVFLLPAKGIADPMPWQLIRILMDIVRDAAPT